MYPQVTQFETRDAEVRAELELIRRLRAAASERRGRVLPSLRLRRARRSAACSA
jgi:hypothetical protein